MTTKTFFVEQELSPAGEDGDVDALAPTTTLTVLVESVPSHPHLHLKMVDGEGNTTTFVVNEDEALALCRGLQQATFFLRYMTQPATLM